MDLKCPLASEMVNLERWKVKMCLAMRRILSPLEIRAYSSVVRAPVIHEEGEVLGVEDKEEEAILEEDKEGTEAAT